MARRPTSGILVLRPGTLLAGAGLLLGAAALLLAWAVPADPTVGFGAEHVVAVVGADHAWHVRYPGPDGRLGTDDDLEGAGDLHLPRGVPTRLLVQSEDFIYTLRVPALGVDDVAVPGLSGELRIDAPRTGTYALEGGQMCGTRYPGLQGHVVVHERGAYWRALRQAGAR